MRNICNPACLLIFLSLLAVTSCEKEPAKPWPELYTLSVSDVTPQGFMAHGKIENKENQKILEMGFLYSLEPRVDEAYSEKVIAGNTINSGKYSLFIENALIPNELYYVRAFVRTSGLVVYAPFIEVRSKGGKSPVITSFSPAMGVPGDTIVLMGRHFSYSAIGNKVSLNNVEARVLENPNDTTVRFVVPFGVTSGESELLLKVAGNSVLAPGKFLVSNLVIHSVEPIVATYNDTVTISGENFGYNAYTTRVFFNEVESQIVSVTPDQIRAMVPATLLYPSAKVKVSAHFGEAQFQDNFQLLPPEVLQFVPDTLTSLLDTITIVGKNFTSHLPSIKIRVKGRDARLIDANETQIRFQLNEITYFNHDSLISIRDTFHLSLKLSNQGEAEGTPQRFLNVNYQSRFTPLKPFPGQGKGYARSFTYNEKGYVILGFNGVNPTNQFWEYDPENDGWSQKPSFPGSPRFRAFSFVIGNELFIGGGEDGENYFNDFYKYNFFTDSWSQLTDYPDTITSMAVAFALDNLGYVGTGYKFNGVPIYSNRFWIYVPETDKWSQTIDFPRSTFGAVSFTHDGDGFVYDKNKLFRFDGSSWFEEDSYALNKSNMLAVKKGHRVCMGLGGSWFSGSRYIYVYNFLDGQWSTKPIPYFQSRHGSSGFSIGDRIFIVGGFGDFPDYFHQVFEYNPDLP